MLKSNTKRSSNHTPGSTPSQGSIFSVPEGPDLKWRRTRSSSQQEHDIVEINDSPGSSSSSGRSVLSKDFPFANFIDKEFMISAFKN